MLELVDFPSFIILVIFQSIASPSWTCFLWFAGRRPPFSSMPKRQRPWLVHYHDHEDGADDDDDDGADGADVAAADCADDGDGADDDPKK